MIDPSLQGTSAIAIAGHPSETNPPAEGGGSKHVLHTDANGNFDVFERGQRHFQLSELRVAADSAVVLHSNEVHLGSNPTDFAALASLVDQLIGKLDDMFRTWSPVPQDGGAALKAAFASTFPVPPTSVAASQVKVR